MTAPRRDAASPRPVIRDSLAAIRTMLGLVLTIMVFTVIYFARELLLPVVIGLVIALTLSPLVRWLGRRGIPASISATTIIILAVALAALGALLLATQVQGWVDDLPRITWQIRNRLSIVFDSVATAQDISEQVGSVATGGAAQPETVVVQQPGLLTNAVSGVASVGTSVLVGLILALLLLGSGRAPYEKLVAVFPRLEDKKRALRIAYDIEARISRYLLSITVINFGLGVTVGLWLWLIGLPYAAAWGLLVMMVNFLPYAGFIVGVALVGTYGVLTLDSTTAIILAPLGYFLINALEGQLVTPYLLGRSLRLNTVSVFLAVILWAWLWDIPGALMAVPVLVSFKVMCDHIPSLAWLGNLLGATGASDPDEDTA